MSHRFRKFTYIFTKIPRKKTIFFAGARRAFALSFDKIGGTSAIQKKIFAFLLVLRSVCTIFAIYRLKHCFFNQKHLFL